jgi:site-specific recombinase XerD
MLKLYFESLLLRNYSKETIQKHRLQLNDFIRCCAERDLTQPREVTRQLIQSYQRSGISCVRLTNAASVLVQKSIQSRLLNPLLVQVAAKE